MNRIWSALDQLEPKQKLMIAIGAPLLVLGAYFMMIMGPRLSRTAELRTHIASMEKDREAKLVDAGTVPERQKEVEELEGQLQLAIRRLPDEKEIPQLLSSISTLGRDSGLDILVFRQKPEGYQEFYAEVPVEMQVRGTYHQVAKFFDRVRKLDRIVNVTNIVLRDPEIVDDDLLLEANSQVTTFRFLSEPERQKLIKEKKIKGEKR
jgi:type IV pilus assembly protein PilO